MLKKISVAQIREGMYIHALCGPWLAHPFWRTSFLIDSPQLCEKVRQSGVDEFWIDTERGVDVLLTPSRPNLAQFPSDTRPAPMGQEVQRAAALCNEAREAVINMFSEARMGGAIDTQMAGELVQAITNSVERHPDALISVARLKTVDNYTYMHSVAVSGLMVALARTMGWHGARLQQAGMAGLLHDMGKAHMRTDILNKPGALTDEEFAHMKSHPEEGYAILKTCITDEAVLDACLHHHERLDGRGYPHRLAGAQIQQLARMTAICDIYDAITSDRPYKKGWSPSIALQRMAEWCNGHLDRQIFEAFVRTIGIYPVGSLVRLQSGLLGVVCAPSQASMSTPRVLAFYHIAQKRMLQPAKLIDLAKDESERIIAKEELEDWPFRNLDQLWRKAAAALT